MNDTFLPNEQCASPPLIGVIQKSLPIEGRSYAELGLMLNLSLLCAALIAHIISKVIAKKDDDIPFERRTAHDIAIECKRLEAIIAKKEKEMKQLNEEIHKLEAHVEIVENENRSSKKNICEVEKRLQEELKATIEMEKAKNTAIDERLKLEISIENLNERLKKTEEERSIAFESLSESQKTVSKLEGEIKNERAAKEKLQLLLDHSKETLAQKEKEKIDLEDQISGLTVLLDESENIKEPRQSKSNASDGWSDFEEEIKPTVTRSLKPIELRELSKLRKELSKLEKEHETTLHNIERATEDKQRLENEVIGLKKDIEAKTKELETRDADRRGSEERATQLLNLIQESNAKINEKEIDIKNLGEQVQKYQLEIHVLKDQVHSKESKMRDLDVEVKRWRNDYLRLETTSYSKEQELVRTIQSLQTFMQPPVSFNTSRNSSFKDNASFRMDEQSSLWDQPEMESTMIRSLSSPEDDFLPHPIKSGRSRRSNLLVTEFLSGNESKSEKKETTFPPRRRSRSHGRQNGNLMGAFCPPRAL